MLSVTLSVTADNNSSYFVPKAWTLSFCNWAFDEPLHSKMPSQSPLILEKSWIIQAIGLPATDLFPIELCLLLWWLVSWSSLFGCSWVRLQIWESRFPKSGIGFPVKGAVVMRSSILVALSTSPIQSSAVLGHCEEWETSLLKLILQLLNADGWSRLSIVMCSASLLLGTP